MRTGIVAVLCAAIFPAAADAATLLNVGTPTSPIFELPEGNGVDVASLEQAGPGMSSLVSAAAGFETTTFTNPTGSLTIRLGDDGGEGLLVKPLNFNKPVHVEGGGGHNVLGLENGATLADGSVDLAGGTDALHVSGTSAPEAFSLLAAPMSRLELQLGGPAEGLTIAGTESVSLDGSEGPDIFEIFSLTDVADLATVELNGGMGDDGVIPELAAGPTMSFDGGPGSDFMSAEALPGAADNISIAPAKFGGFAISRNTLVAAAAVEGHSTEALSLNASDGDDQISVDALPGVSDLGTIGIQAGTGDDVVNVAPSSTVTVNLHGGAEGTADVLAYTSGCAEVAQTETTLTAAGAKTATYVDFERVDIPATFRMATTTVVTDESAGAVMLDVTRGAAGAASVNYLITQNGVAAAADFGQPTGTLSFAPGETAKSFSVPLVDDASAEPTEVFVASLTPSGLLSQVCSPSAAMITLTDDDVVTAGGRFAIRKLKASRKNGTVTLVLTVPAAGTVRAVAKAKVKLPKRSRRVAAARGKLVADGASEPSLKLRPTRRGRRILASTGSLRVSITATFTPSQGESETARRSVTLRLSRR